MAFRLGYRPFVVAALFTAGIVFTGANAHAQIGNAPVMPGGIGISQAGRQAILDSRLRDSRPRNLVRGADGSLLEIGRQGNQAFLRTRSNDVFFANSRVGWGSGLGTGLGWGNAGGRASYTGGSYGARNDSLWQWISMIQPTMGRSYSDSGLADSGGKTPIDEWIGQTD